MPCEHTDHTPIYTIGELDDTIVILPAEADFKVFAYDLTTSTEYEICSVLQTGNQVNIEFKS